MAAGGCAAFGPRPAGAPSNLYPPPPQTPHVVALGMLEAAPPPTPAEVNLAMFLFGTEPTPGLALAAPAALAAGTGEVLITDAALRSVFRWDVAARQLDVLDLDPAPAQPLALDVATDGSLLVTDGPLVRRYDPAGRQTATYALDPADFRPGGALAVGDSVWVCNLAQHRIEVFDAASGAHRGSHGSVGGEPGQLALPRSLARTPEGDVCVVDLLNSRIQVFAPDGRWLRSIGQSGDSVGTFGRPRDVAVGPDGTVFVTDAFAQRVQAFTPEGLPLLAFGEPGSGVGALALPGGIAISTVPPSTTPPPPGTTPAYYVLVAELLDRPGVRVYGWLPPQPGEVRVPLPGGEGREWRPAFPESVAINPHWHPQRCDVCHEPRDGELAPIPPERVDALCLSCHDGIKAPADPHPIGRPAGTEGVQTPDTWPTVAGAIGCLTCHDIIRHCSPDARRPAVNAVLLRGFEPQRALEYCGNCHQADVGGRFSPHRQRDATGRVRDDACFFCHTQAPEIPPDGRRQFAPHLRVESSDLCLNCHTKHWDLSPLGHVDRPVTPRVRQWMLMRELALTTPADPAELARLAAQREHPARLPLGNGLVTCYTCHNPHYTGLFPAGSELGALATNPTDRRAALRTDWIDLCSECHHH